MSIYQIIRIFEALLMLLLSIICLGFLHLKLCAFFAFVLFGLYLHLALKGQNE